MKKEKKEKVKDYRLGCFAFIDGICCIDKCFCSGEKNKQTRIKNGTNGKTNPTNNLFNTL